jgi:REP element-mobilizing transposase RayT
MVASSEVEEQVSGPCKVTAAHRLSNARRFTTSAGNTNRKTRTRKFQSISKAGPPAKFVEKLHYMHMNPVKRKLVAHPKDWPWSSFSFYAKKDSGLVRIDPMR